MQGARAGDADAVAGFAEIVGHRCDEAQLAAGLADPNVAGGAACTVVEIGEGVLAFEPRAQHGERQILIGAGCADIAHRHDLDEGQRHISTVRPFHQGWNFVLVQVFERDRIDLDGETRGLRGVNACHDLLDVAPARDLSKPGGVERIERHVDPFYAAILKLVGEANQLRSVCRERQLLQRSRLEVARQGADQRHHVAADQRFATCQPQLAHTLGDECRAQTIKLLQREQIRLRQESHVFGHAVKAAKVATIRHGYAQIADASAERVDHFPGARSLGGGRTTGHLTSLVATAYEVFVSFLM